MPPPKKSLGYSLVDLPLKIFVKENSDSAELEKKHKFHLEFQANEAKSVYDEIVSSDSKNTTDVSNSNAKPIITKQKVKSVERSIKSIDALFKAIEMADMKLIGQYFNSKNVNIIDQFGWTPLMSAAYSGHVEIVDFFLKLNANTKAVDRSGYTAMDLAHKKNHVHVVNLIRKYLSTNRRKEIVSNVKGVQDNESNGKRLDDKGFYCQVCQHFFMETSQSSHESSTLHVFNNKPKIKNTFYGIPKQNKGYQMLLNTGWQEERGLGPSGEGKKYPIKTILKRDRKGFGDKVQKNARITHFEAKDPEAIKHVNKYKRKYSNKKEWEWERKRDVARTRILRQALS